MRTLRVDLADRSYPIYIGPKLLGREDLLTPHIKGKQVCLVTNTTLAKLLLPEVKASLGQYDYTEVILPDGEAHKNLETLNLIFDELLRARHTRKTTLIALGGGVIGDMTGFAAACYQRGVDFIQLPTTLLSQVDSSVGGKTAVNHALGKNMIGAFYQPNCVIADSSVLQKLPERELAAGLAEVIKYGLIADEPFYEWLEANMSALSTGEQDALSYAIERSCQIKADVVAEDERESGLRAILNLGHTFGHAIETHMGYGEYLHGEAVAIGMQMAIALSASKGWVDAELIERNKALSLAAGLPVITPDTMRAEEFLPLMAVDKKVLDGRLRLVLLSALGKAVVTEEVTEEEVLAAIEACRS
ncbi:3-dehydroquinate synthase [Pseudoteredinibacter isoporae]|uniref:3-dehydroquinate synthase n=1 Tax=Pseudoteredinibacter isoporae TaxID=570281 RepID=A0A7X0MWF6_9GAMM|nr:3-dehydroquinate synthase [Pseudoteredinibacter isoporae]MBB6519797.1 3-dehydroquinate synthase [Pseudoteredinibacter isoporae]NHO85378.1 3-dehydroquinate synthase [Pseudoteredinibacter isoporae]NIB26170.1 3-dehydroquinate synthase [Pseudoteredinibacter isoporae]